MRTSTVILLGALAAAVAAYFYSRTQRGSALLADASRVVASVGDYVGLTNRGMRDNNPGNVRRSSANVWVGELSRAEVEANGGTYDPEFEQFSSIQYGVRALGHTLLTYSTKYGIKTVRGAISRYAPASENDTASYIDDVCYALGVQADQPLDMRSILPELAQAIMRRETGYVGDIQQITDWVYS